MSQKEFFIPEHIAQEQSQMMGSPRGRILIASCHSGSHLSDKVVERYQKLSSEAGSKYGVTYLRDIDRKFSDSETCVRLDSHVGGCDVFLFQALLNPTLDYSIDQNYMAFLIAARAFRENGASHVTGILPYLAYARQDKPSAFMREPTTARLMADLTVTAGVDRLIVWDPHCGQIRGFYGSIPVNMLESLTLFIDEFERFRGDESVIAVAPDAGASKFVTYSGRALDLKCAIASKYRPAPEKVVISEIIGDFAGKTKAVILDDMISVGGTIEALIRKLVDEKGINEVYLGVSHCLCLEKAREILLSLHKDYNLKEIIVTNSIPQTKAFQEIPFLRVRCLSDTFARTINRIHYNQSVSEVFFRP